MFNYMVLYSVIFLSDPYYMNPLAKIEAAIESGVNKLKDASKWTKEFLVSLNILLFLCNIVNFWVSDCWFMAEIPKGALVSQRVEKSGAVRGGGGWQ